MRHRSEESAEESSSALVVVNVKKREDGTKNYQKRNYCLFCDKSYSKIARHLEQKHSSEAEVAKVLSCPKKSKQRRLQLDYLRKRGNRAHNVEAMKEGKGFVVPCKQSSRTNANASDYQHCPNCQGLFMKKFMWRHMKGCALAQKCGNGSRGKSRIQSVCAFAQPVPANVTEQVWKLVSNMCQDKIAEAVRNDRAILALGEYMLNRNGESQEDYIRGTLREVGRLVLAGKAVTPLRKAEEYVLAKNFQHFITAVKAVAGYDEDTKTLKNHLTGTQTGP